METGLALPDQARHHKYCHHALLAQTIETGRDEEGEVGGLGVGGLTQREGGSLNVALLYSGRGRPNGKAKEGGCE